MSRGRRGGRGGGNQSHNGNGGNGNSGNGGQHNNGGGGQSGQNKNLNNRKANNQNTTQNNNKGQPGGQNNRNNTNGWNNGYNQKNNGFFQEGRHVEDLTQRGQYFPTKLHMELLSRGDALMEIHKEWEGAFHARNQQSPGHSLWDLVGYIPHVDKNLCFFMHPAGIKKDGDGDVVMGTPKVCKCISGDYNIPDCFLRSFYYMIAVNEYRKGNGEPWGQGPADQDQVQ